MNVCGLLFQSLSLPVDSCFFLICPFQRPQWQKVKTILISSWLPDLFFGHKFVWTPYFIFCVCWDSEYSHFAETHVTCFNDGVFSSQTVFQHVWLQVGMAWSVVCFSCDEEDTICATCCFLLWAHSWETPHPRPVHSNCFKIVEYNYDYIVCYYLYSWAKISCRQKIHLESSILNWTRA